MVLRVVLVVILLLLVARFLYLLVQRTMAVVRGGESRTGGGRGVPLVACSRCGVMVPRPRAIPHGADAWHCRSCAGR